MPLALPHAESPESPLATKSVNRRRSGHSPQSPCKVTQSNTRAPIYFKSDVKGI